MPLAAASAATLVPKLEAIELRLCPSPTRTVPATTGPAKSPKIDTPARTAAGIAFRIVTNRLVEHNDHLYNMGHNCCSQ